MSTPSYKAQISPPNGGASSLPIDRRRRTAGKPYVPDVNITVPPVQGEDGNERYVALVYDNTGKYLGWMTTEDAKAWYYSLFYATSNAYKVTTKKYVQPFHTLVIISEKSTGRTALMFGTRALTKVDIVDPSEVEQKIEATKELVANAQWHSGSYRFDPPDPFGLLGKIYPTAKQELLGDLASVNNEMDALRKKQEAEMNALAAKKVPHIEKYRKKLIGHLDSLSNAEKETKKGSEEAGINLDF